MRVAAIDLGSNSCVFLVLERRDGVLYRVESQRRITRLGAGLDAKGLLDAAAMARSLEALRHFVGRAGELGVERLVAVGTAALREASNRQLLIEAAAGFGLTLRAISGDEEAAISFASVAASGPALVVDVGGASTEFAWGDGSQMIGRRSLPIGSVRLHERLALEAPSRPGALVELASVIDDELAALPPMDARPMMAVAGTAVSAAQAILGLKTYDHQRLDGQHLTAGALRRLIEAMAAMSVPERMAHYGLEAGRADVLPAGLMVLSRAMHRFGLEGATVRDRGIAWGLARAQFEL